MPAPYAVFCVSPLDPRSAEPDFTEEVAAAREAGFTPVLLDHDELDQRVNPTAALRKTRIEEPGRAVYRGWMLRSEAYEALFNTLLERGVELLTSPAAYAACHHAPGSYAQLATWMARTGTVPAAKMDEPSAIKGTLEGFGSSALVLKDWVKSQAAGYWAEACFIPDASDYEQAGRVIARFRELQGESLVGGLVFRSYLQLLPVGAPAHEHRAFMVDGRVVGCWPRSEEASRVGSPPPELLAEVAANIPSRFASADFGVDESGRWWLLEVGDGQVSGLPTDRAAAPIFQALAQLVG
ncbi:MAG: ATP-grasp domain-containing protein [Caulobacterales bacterium]|nr:ATP-grasp domain-containing protein [Caulobacterales bacterium]